MRLPTQELKPNEERKRRRRTVPTINGNTISRDPDGDLDETTMIRQEKVANFSHHKRVADYLLGRSVGEGSFAKVRLGLHVQTAEEVAIKVISKARARKDAYVHKNLRREGRILQMTRHKNVVQVYDVLETDNNYYLVTEFCKGGELIDIVTDKGCLPENDVRRYVAQLVSAVSHLHEHGIVHRDLKVENLLLDDHGDIKIIDFGLSNVISGTCSDPTRALATQCGSPAYAAPELLAKHMYGPKVDVWSIGVITYALLVGKLPFTVEPFRIPKLCRKMMLGDMNPIPTHLSTNCRQFIKRLLISDPDIRPGISQVMKMQWLSVVGKPSKMSTYGKSLSRSEYIIYSTTDINTEVVREMTSKLDFEFANVLNCVRKNRPGEALATYYLLLKQMKRFRDSKDRRHNDVIGSDGNLDHGNESDKSSDEEGLNDVDDVTDDDIYSSAFKKEIIYKNPTQNLNLTKDTGRLDSPNCNKTIVDNLIEKHVSEKTTNDPRSSLMYHENNNTQTPSTPKGNSLQRKAAPSSSHKSTGRKSNGDIDRTLQRLENVQKRYENHFETGGKVRTDHPAKEAKKITTADSSLKGDSVDTFPEVESASGGNNGRPERKSRGPNSMRELMRTMSRAKDALQRRSIFGQGKYSRGEDKKSSGSPELNTFRKLLSKNSHHSGVSSDRQPTSPVNPAESHNAQAEEKMWKNYVPNGGTHPMRAKLPEASPATTPLNMKDMAHIPTRNSMQSYCHHTSPRSPRTMTFYAGRPSLAQRMPNMQNRSRIGGATTQETVQRHLPRISVDKNDPEFTNPPAFDNLTPRYHFPSPPRTPSSRETSASGTTASGVKEIIEKFHSLMNKGETFDRGPARESQRSSPSPRPHDANVTALAYLAVQRRRREDTFLRKVPNTAVPKATPASRPTSNEGNYAPPPQPFACHFGGDQDFSKRQATPSGSPTYRTPSRGIWYKSAV